MKKLILMAIMLCGIFVGIFQSLCGGVILAFNGQEGWDMIISGLFCIFLAIFFQNFFVPSKEERASFFIVKVFLKSFFGISIILHGVAFLFGLFITRHIASEMGFFIIVPIDFLISLWMIFQIKTTKVIEKTQIKNQAKEDISQNLHTEQENSKTNPPISIARILGKIGIFLIVVIMIYMGNSMIPYKILTTSNHFGGEGITMLIPGTIFMCGGSQIFIKYLCTVPLMRFFAAITFSILGGFGAFYGFMMVFDNFESIFSGSLILSLGIFWFFSALEMAIQIKNDHFSKK